MVESTIGGAVRNCGEEAGRFQCKGLEFSFCAPSASHLSHFLLFDQCLAPALQAPDNMADQALWKGQCAAPSSR